MKLVSANDDDLDARVFAIEHAMVEAAARSRCRIENTEEDENRLQN